jgi:uncharacterized membrane protein YcaP (DUF421 family)
MGTILRAVVVYLFLLLIIRVVGRRSFEQMTPFELILMFMLGGMGIQAIVSDDRSLTNALMGMMTVALMHILISWLKVRSGAIGRLIDGTPIVIVEDGRWHEDALRRMRLHTQDVMTVARQAGLEHLSQIQFAVVERNGSISIIRKQQES